MKRLMNAVWLGVLLGGTLAVYATPTLKIYDGSGSMTIADGDANDTDSTAGIVSWSGTVGNWYVQVTTGITKPALGSAISPRFDLLTLDTFKTGPGPSTLVVEFSENDFTVPLPAGAKAEVGGTLESTTSLLYKTYVGHDNVEFTKSALITTMGPYGPGGSFSGTTYGSVPAPPSPGNVSFTLVLELTDTSVGGFSSVDATLAVPDTGSSLLLLGSALGCLGLLARSRKN